MPMGSMGECGWANSMITPTDVNVSAWLLAEFCIHCGGVPDSYMTGHCIKCQNKSLSDDKRPDEFTWQEINNCSDWRKKVFNSTYWPTRGKIIMVIKATPANVSLWQIAPYCIDCGGLMGRRYIYHCPNCYNEPKCLDRPSHSQSWFDAMG
jgi:hypothetical protein